jgi:uncharacterized membrane protein
MADRKLVNFIRESMNNGHSLDVIKPVLRAKGWSENEIEKASERATQSQLVLSVAISFILFIILTAAFVFSLVFSQTKLTAAVVGTADMSQNIGNVSLAFTLYIAIASLIWLKMLFTFMNRKNRI